MTIEGMRELVSTELAGYLKDMKDAAFIDCNIDEFLGGKIAALRWVLRQLTAS